MPLKEFLYQLAQEESPRGMKMLLCALLRGVSLFYAFGVWGLLLAYRRGWLPKDHLPCPVISVGNLTLGGVGKTPMVLWLTEFLLKEGYRPAVLLRGYMPLGTAAVGEGSDEAQLLKERLTNVPVLVGADRFQMANKILKTQAVDCFILDDGFQHWKLNRDLDIVAVDAARGFGNGALLPRGILREPLSSLQRAQLVVLTKSDLGEKNLEALKETLSRFNPRAPVFLARHRPVGLTRLRHPGPLLAFEILKGQRVIALSAIGDPNSFLSLLRKQESLLIRTFSFLDHYVYTAEDIHTFVETAREEKINIFVTTAKDAVKLRPYLNLIPAAMDIYILNIIFEIIQGEDEFLQRISGLLRR